MNSLKYIIRNKAKTIILVSCVFMISFTLFVTFIFKSANEQLKNLAYDNIPYQVTLNGRLFHPYNTDLTYHSPSYEHELKYVKEVIDELSALPEVKSFELHESLIPYVKNVGINAEENANFDIEKQIKHNDISDSIIFFGLDNSTYFDNKNIKIIDGRNFTQEDIDNGKNLIIINENTYIKDGDNIRKALVGDKINAYIVTGPKGVARPDKFKPIVEEAFTYEIIGIYETREINITNIETDEFKLNQRFYLPNKSIDDYFQSFYHANKKYFNKDLLYEDLNLNLTYVLPTFTLNNLDDCKTFLHKANNALQMVQSKYLVNEKAFDTYHYIATSTIDNIAPVTEPIENSSNNLNNAVIIIIFFLSFAYALIYFFFIKTRIKEFAIMRSLGANFKTIMKQLLLENIIYISVGLSLSYFLSYTFANIIIKDIFTKSITAQNNILRLSSNLNTTSNLYFDISSISFSISAEELLISILVICIIAILINLATYLYLKKTNIKNLLLH